MHIYIERQVDLGFGDVQKRIGVVSGLLPGFPAVQYIIRPGGYLAGQVRDGP
jgi:hypothetical protein